MTLTLPTRWACNAAQSANPELWHGAQLMWCPGKHGQQPYQWLPDQSGHGRHGVAVNTRTYTHAPPIGWGAQNGFSSYYNHGYDVLTENNKPFSVIVWARRTSNTSQGIVSKDVNGVGRYWFLGTNANYQVYVRVCTPGSTVTHAFSSAYGDFPNETWTQIGFVVDPVPVASQPGYQFYYILNGKRTAASLSAAWNGTCWNDATVPLRLGTYYSGSYDFDGQIGPGTVYDRILSEDEVQQLYVDPYAQYRMPATIFKGVAPIPQNYGTIII